METKEIIVKGLLIDGKVYNIDINISQSDIYEDKKTGIKTIEGKIKCSRCKGSNMCLSHHMSSYIIFCSDVNCLYQDASISKKDEYEKWKSKHETQWDRKK